MIPGLDKFQRKIIHKLCERFYVLREVIKNKLTKKKIINNKK